MRIALVSLKYKIYPISLLKIGSYLKDNGHYCELFWGEIPKENFDEIWITTLFTFDIYEVVGLIRKLKQKYKKIKVGGVSASLLPDVYKKEGVDVHIGLWPEVENYSPDYSLLKEKPEYSITHTSRGCVRKCGFCMVHKLEPVFHKREWEKDILVGTKKILFYDNNFNAQKTDDLKKDVNKILQVVDKYKIKEIDFNQGLDCRLLTDEKADLLASLPITPIRFAFDGMHEDGKWQEAIIKMAERGKWQFVNYTLYNYEDKPEEMYYRVKEAVNLSMKHKIGCKMFPMKYQPILEINKKRNYTGKYWNETELNNFKNLITNISPLGIISFVGGSFSPEEEFFFWFGKNDNEFKKMLNYKNAKKLFNIKKHEIREKRYSIKRAK